MINRKFKYSLYNKLLYRLINCLSLSNYHLWLLAFWSPSWSVWTEPQERPAPSSWVDQTQTPAAADPPPPPAGKGWWGSGQGLGQNLVLLGWRVNVGREGLLQKKNYSLDEMRPVSYQIMWLFLAAQLEAVGCGTKVVVKQLVFLNAYQGHVNIR